MSEIAANIRAVRERIRAAADRAGRSPHDITLVGVSKAHPVSAAAEAFRAGLRDLGENRVQEAGAKIIALRAAGSTPRWHLLGHLQRNKVRVALDLFDILHGVDSVRIAEALSGNARRPVPILIEVNVTGEATKFGVAPGDLPSTVLRLRQLPNIDVRGLMTVAPRVDNPEDVRPVFRALRTLRDRLELKHLSMGMSDDFEVAVEEGATLVRVGRAIFGAPVR
ncbi:MAG TPA: YggS family pyridoxal phosphate-dependent enzyme [Dehalococcoidia bacterium]|nr:YggS family pyridoxal phosphate-dependent enzyme [Dehalococcoidia bacterium]